ncbi:MAG: penicillin-binding transpeptidase domain-containing protein [Bacteriovoracaceae bacterium]|jgi:cell division protein FtsI/penicillin-binding protein 2|nr:hypothetical protein [Halobacteriovoraceae bacterium]MDP7321280.1 penicillin-binding transpeptidase domain-containing protein [Bacteriovoracaceae bacterium]
MLKKYFLAFAFVPMLTYANFNFYKDLSLKPLDTYKFSEKLTYELFQTDKWPEDIEFNDKSYRIEYTFNEKLTKYIKWQLRRYRSDFASVVVIDNNTGKILSAVDYTRQTKKFGKNITFSSTDPAASVFKVITAADLLENTEVSESSKFSYVGKATTLYKYQLKDKKSRWVRTIPFEKAFAYSNNVVFGKAAIKNTSYSSLSQTARKFGFNQNLLQLVNAGTSKLFPSGDDYGLAELASGFNRKTLISPVHGAIIASIIANDGVYKKPTLVEKVTDQDFDRVVWQPFYEIEQVLNKTSSEKLQNMMELTVKRGTARGAFRPWKIKNLKDIHIGGKTGTITGGVPYGKRDWFVSYAVPQDENDKGISVCVMIINVKKWYIKSTVMAKKIINYYYTKVNNE